MMAEVMGETQNPRHVTTAHFRGRFTDFAIERSVLLDDQHAGGRVLAFDERRRRCAGKCAADDHDIVNRFHAV